MHITLEPDLNFGLYEGLAPAPDVHAAARAMFASVEYMQCFGAQRQAPTDADKQLARDVFSESVPIQAIQSSSSAIHLRALLEEYDHRVVSSVVQLRQYITNRLVEEAAPGNKGALRALELLGKISGVDLFTERTEVTLRAQPSRELLDLVRAKLAKLAQAHDAQDVAFRPAGAPALAEGAPLPAEPVPELRGNPLEASEKLFETLLE